MNGMFKPYTSFEDGGIHGPMDGKVDSIYHDYQCLFRKSDYLTHKEIFDRADKIFAKVKGELKPQLDEAIKEAEKKRQDGLDDLL